MLHPIIRGYALAVLKGSKEGETEPDFRGASIRDKEVIPQSNLAGF